MGVLAKKLMRTIWNTRGQFLAVMAVVTVGVSVYISMTTSYYNLKRAQDSFYLENNFADYYFHVVRAPQQITRQIESVPGVARATGRIQKDVPVIKEGHQRATARLISYPVPMDGEVNRLHLLSGRLFELYPQSGGIEVVTDPQYAAGNGLDFNDTVTVVAGGRQVPLTVVGTGTAPEIIYPMKDTSTLIPDPETFGIIMLPRDQAQQLLDLPGQVNQVVVKLSPGADEEKVAGQVKALLEPYGNLAAYPRKKQLSHAILQGELDQLQATSRFLPTIFLGLAAAIQFIMLGRMIKSQRLQIGVMKALGYNNRQVMTHYTGYSLAVAVSGAILGTLLGMLFASLFSLAYARYFNLPEAIGGVNVQSVIYGFALSLGVGAIAGLTASRGVVAINPAESMRPKSPGKAVKIWIDRWPWIWRRLDPAWKMGLRTIGRNRGRFLFTLVGVIFAVGMLVVALFSNDSIDYLIKKHFYQDQRYDFLIRFASPVKNSELSNIARIDGVLKTEPVLEVPVKIHFNGRAEEDLLLGLPPDATLKRPAGSDGRPLQLQEEGILISRRTADKLGARAGDRVEVETLLGIGPSRRSQVKIMGFNSQLIGGGSYIALDQANRVLQETQLVSGAMLKVDPGQAAKVEEDLNGMNGVSSVLSRQKELDNFNKNLDSMVYSIMVMVFFAVVLGFAIIYNSSVISFAERKREFASLRVLGFTTREVAGVLLKENMLHSLLGVALGLPFGLMMARGFVKSMSTDIYSMPVVVYPLTYALSALGGIFFIMLAHMLAVRGVRRLDLVEVLKNRD